MRMTIENNIKFTITTKNAKWFMKFVENWSYSESGDKSLARTLTLNRH